MSTTVSRSVPDSRAVRRTLPPVGSWPVTLRSLRVLTGIAVTFLLLLFGPASAVGASPQSGAHPAAAAKSISPQSISPQSASPWTGTEVTADRSADSRTVDRGATAAPATAALDHDASFPGYAAPRPADTGEAASPQRTRPTPADENAESRGSAALGERAPPGR